MATLNTPIEMIAVHSKDGSIKPIRFRVETSDGEEHVIKIASLKHVNEERFGAKDKIRKFLCLVIINDMQRMCEIAYNLNTMKWTLLRM